MQLIEIAAKNLAGHDHKASATLAVMLEDSGYHYALAAFTVRREGGQVFADLTSVQWCDDPEPCEWQWDAAASHAIELLIESAE